MMKIIHFLLCLKSNLSVHQHVDWLKSGATFMLKLIMLIPIFGVLMACQSMNEHSTQKMVGGQTDAHGCLVATGATWSVLKQQCVRVFEVADIRLQETIDSTTYGVYVILSEDKQKAEVFAVSLPQNPILTAVKGGFISDDNRVRLINQGRTWRLTQQE